MEKRGVMEPWPEATQRAGRRDHILTRRLWGGAALVWAAGARYASEERYAVVGRRGIWFR